MGPPTKIARFGDVVDPPAVAQGAHPTDDDLPAAKRARTDIVEHMFEPTVVERHAAAIAAIDTVRPGARPSQRAAAAWMSSAFGVHWPSKFHPTHKLTLAVPFVFCRVCGHSSQARGRPGLRAVCTGSPSAESNYGGHLRRMLQGKAPCGETAVLCPPRLAPPVSGASAPLTDGAGRGFS